ncbi:MAG: hypothetical protein WKF46_10930, partial [Candidatus Limnocylindrales bacterium]
MSEPVTIVTHDPSKAGGWRDKGAEVAVADVHDTDALRRLFRQGQRLFLLDPPADPSTETDVEERKSVVSITEALQGSGLEKVVAESTYGAQPGERSGDLNILYEMEQALAVQPIPFSVIRAAYDMSNWDASLGAARSEGVVHTLFPADLELPMVSPADLGRVAARLLTEPAGRTNLHYVEGPERYSAADVATAFADALEKPVRVETVPRDQWEATFKELGFSESTARSYARMTAVTVDQAYDMPESP